MHVTEGELLPAGVESKLASKDRRFLESRRPSLNTLPMRFVTEGRLLRVVSKFFLANFGENRVRLLDVKSSFLIN